MARIRWTDKAIKRLQFINEFKTKQDPGSAAAVLNRVRYAALVLADEPEMGRQGRVTGTRELHFSDFPFSLAYRVNEWGVDIIAVVPTERQWPLAL